MLRKNVIEILIKADDKASKQFLAVGSNLQNMEQRVSKAAQTIAVAGLAAGAALAGVIYKTAQWGDNIAKSAKQIGVSTEFLSEMEHAAKISGATVEDIMLGTKRLSKAMSDASYGLETYTRSFDALGINIRDSEGKLRDVEDILPEVADRFKALENDTQRSALAQELFGRGGLRLIPLLKRGAEGIEELRQEARELGISLDKDAAEGSEELIDSLTRLKGSLRGIGITITKELDEPLTKFLNKLAKETIPATGEWLKENKDVITTSTKVGLGLTGAALGYSALSKAMTAAAAHPFLALFGVALAITIINLEKAKSELGKFVKEGENLDVLKEGEQAIRGVVDSLKDYAEQARAAELAGGAWTGPNKEEIAETEVRINELEKALAKLEGTQRDVNIPIEASISLTEAETEARDKMLQALGEYNKGLITGEEMQRRWNEALIAAPDPKFPEYPKPPEAPDVSQYDRIKDALEEQAETIDNINELLPIGPRDYGYVWMNENEKIDRILAGIIEKTSLWSESIDKKAIPSIVYSYEQIKLIDEIFDRIIKKTDEWSMRLEEVPELVNPLAEAAAESQERWEQAMQSMSISSQDVALDISQAFGDSLGSIVMNTRNAAQMIENIWKSMIARLISRLFSFGLISVFGKIFGAKEGLEIVGAQHGLEFIAANRGLEFLGAQSGLEVIGGQYLKDTVPVMMHRNEIAVPSPTVERLNKFLDKIEGAEFGVTNNYFSPFLPGSHSEALTYAEWSEAREKQFEKYLARGSL